MRLSATYTLFTIIILLCGIVVVTATSYQQKKSVSLVTEHANLVATLKLTDLCLFTEARYTRHPAMADNFAPFQDHPGALEHFPSGSLVSPPTMRKHATNP